MATQAQHDLLLGAAAHGDASALETLVRTHHDRVYRFGVRVCRDLPDAEDAVQEAFVKLAGRPEVVRHPRALYWIFEVVKNNCVRLARTFLQRRKRLGERAQDIEALSQVALSPEAALERWQLVAIVHNAIASLEEPYRAVVVLRDLEGLSGSEVCSMLSISEPAMKSRLHRGRQDIRTFIEREIGEPIKEK